MLRMMVWMGGLCLSLASAPFAIEKLEEKGLLERAGLGGLAEIGHLFGGGSGGASLPTEGEINGALTELTAGGKIVSKKDAAPRVITPGGEMDEEDYRRLVKEAERLAPVALTRARLKRGSVAPGTPQEEFERAMAEAQQREGIEPVQAPEAEPETEPAPETKPTPEPQPTPANPNRR